MFKKTHVKTIATFCMIGLIIITALGTINITELKEIKENIADINIEKSIDEKIEYIYSLIIIIDVIYSIFCIVLSIIFSKFLSKPITKLISDARKIVSDENKIDKQKDNINQDEVLNAFNMVTEELKENLNEMTRQKSK